MSEHEAPKRSSGALQRGRNPLSWPKHHNFRILSIDGGGIRGIYPTTFLAELEDRYLAGASVTRYFDLITGTSTGGIIAIGLAAGLTATEISDIYRRRGHEIFPPVRGSSFNTLRRRIANLRQLFKYRYDRKALTRILAEMLGDKNFGQATNRLCIPSFDGHYGEPYIFKTPHHPDFRNDGYESMTKVATATAAAPTFFQPLQEGGYTFVDGGIWANNPIMIGLIDTLTCFDVARENIRILSLGCGDQPYIVHKRKVTWGGRWFWRDILYAAMRLQSLNALGQAGLLIGPEHITRIDAPASEETIPMDDWTRAKDELPDAAYEAAQRVGDQVADTFLTQMAQPYQPLIDFTK